MRLRALEATRQGFASPGRDVVVLPELTGGLGGTLFGDSKQFNYTVVIKHELHNPDIVIVLFDCRGRDLSLGPWGLEYFCGGGGGASLAQAFGLLTWASEGS